MPDPTGANRLDSTHGLPSARRSRLQKSLPDEIRSAIRTSTNQAAVGSVTIGSEYATRMWQLLDHHRNATIARRAVDPSPISPVRSWLVGDAPQAFYREGRISV